ncbi:MAG: ribonuclease III [Tagaea sp.]
MSAREALEQALGHRFADPDLLTAALAHSSLGRKGDITRSGVGFERLEFLGDRVVGLVAADLLTRRFAGEQEGDLTKRLGQLVRRDTLAALAKSLGVGAALELSPSEERGGGREAAGVLADAFEACAGAIYRDAGFERAYAVVARLFEPLLDASLTPPHDPKSALQEWAQARGLGLPHYELVAQSGASHAPVFTVRVSVEGAAPETAEGPNKRDAERAAAGRLLARVAGGAT